MYAFILIIYENDYMHEKRLWKSFRQCSIGLRFQSIIFTVTDLTLSNGVNTDTAHRQGLGLKKKDWLG